MYSIHGQDFISGFLGLQNVGRALVSEHPKFDVWYYYLIITPLALFAMDTSGYISIAETGLEGIIQPTWRYMVCHYFTILFYCSNQVFKPITLPQLFHVSYGVVRQLSIYCLTLIYLNIVLL